MCKSLAESEGQVKHQKHGLGYSAKQWTVKTRDQQLKKINSIYECCFVIRNKGFSELKNKR